MITLIVTVSLLGAGDTEQSRIDFFEKRVRPVLAERCFQCHRGRKPEGELRVDSLAGLLRGGTRGPAILPGDAEKSLLIRAIHHDELLQMPPKEKLPTRELLDLTRWVAEGAVWPNEDPVPPVTKRHKKTGPLFTVEQTSHWAFQPLAASEPPPVRRSEWISSPIDRFVLARLEAAGLTPAAPADKRALIRRATYDLTGLPPTPEEIDAFLADTESTGGGAEAFARVIDRLLESPRYGERWGRHWLDVARYGDSNGLDENLAYANAFRYRDYVIAAFNANKPFDRFVHEQVAGDLLPCDDESAAIDGILATGFLSIGAKMLAEDDPLKMQMDIIDEQVDTLGKAFLGLTFGCARCHDHKFDPIPTADYYSLVGIFKSTKTMDNFTVVARWHERTLSTPAAPELIAELAVHDRAVAAEKAAVEKITAQANLELLDRARRNVAGYLLAATREWKLQRPSYGADKARHTTPGLRILEADQYVRGNVTRDFETYGQGIGVLVNAGPTPNFAEYDIELDRGGHYQLETRYAALASRPCRLSINGKVVNTNIAGKVTGDWSVRGQKWFVEGLLALRQGKNVLRLEQPEFFPHIDKLLLVPVVKKSDVGGVSDITDERIRERLDHAPISLFVRQWVEYLEATKDDPESVLGRWHDRVRRGLNGKKPSTSFADLADHYEEKVFAPALAALDSDGAKDGTTKDGRTVAALEILRGKTGPLALPENPESSYPAATAAKLKKARDAVAALEKSRPQAPKAMAMAVSEGEIEDVRVHLRGSYLTQGEVAPRRFPRILGGEKQDAIGGDRSGRLELARWLTSVAHPLTSRVMANRIWLWHFGAGLVRTPDNFGKLGTPPTHPALLDWLAREFVKPASSGGAGWSLKAMHRQIMLSSTYRMSTRYDAKAAAIDPDNRLLWRMSRRRLAAEEIRDSILFTAGRLDETMGGSLLPQKNRVYVTSTANVNPMIYGAPRRTVYLPVVRSALNDFLQAFDFAEPSVSNGQRSSTTVAPQALFMMNSELVARSTRHMAERLLADPEGSDDRRVDTIFAEVLGRPPREEETKCALDYTKRYRDAASSLDRDADGADLIRRAWQSYVPGSGPPGSSASYPDLPDLWWRGTACRALPVWRRIRRTHVRPLLVAESLSGVGLGGLPRRQVRGEQGEGISHCQDDAYLDPGDHKPERLDSHLLLDVVEGLPAQDYPQRGADKNAQQRHEGRLQQEAELDHTAAIADGPQDADLLPALHHRAGADDSESGYANQQAEGHEASEETPEGLAGLGLFL